MAMVEKEKALLHDMSMSMSMSMSMALPKSAFLRNAHRTVRDQDQRTLYRTY